jgi:hypothetical protein
MKTKFTEWGRGGGDVDPPPRPGSANGEYKIDNTGQDCSKQTMVELRYLKRVSVRNETYNDVHWKNIMVNNMSFNKLDEKK